MNASKMSDVIYYTTGWILKNYPFKAFKISNRTVSQTPHTHTYFQIWYIKKGSCVHYVNDEKYNLKKGDIFILSPGVVHCIKSADYENFQILGCEFTKEFICDEAWGNNSFYLDYLSPFLSDCNRMPPYCSLDDITSNEVEKLFEEMVKEYDNKRVYFELSMRANFLKLLSVIVKEYNKDSYEEGNICPDKHKRALKTVFEYINEHYNEKIYLNEICRLVFMSPTYFSAIFKENTGKTFTTYLNSVRISKARDLLFDHSKTLGDIALEVGFSDSAYFDRVFKKEMGVAPGKYRKFL